MVKFSFANCNWNHYCKLQVASPNPPPTAISKEIRIFGYGIKKAETN
jgi:hypothetical protein